MHYVFKISVFQCVSFLSQVISFLEQPRKTFVYSKYSILFPLNFTASLISSTSIPVSSANSSTVIFLCKDSANSFAKSEI